VVASLQAKHGRECALERPWTTFEKAVRGCSCPAGPVYYIVVREGAANHKTRVGRNRKVAERSLRKVQVTVDEGAFRPQRNIGFAAWGEQWIASLERKETTVDSYRATVAHARLSFGHRRVRDLRADDVAELSGALRERGLSPSTRAKHLRVLHACLEAALRHDYAARNPVSDLAPGQRPRAERKEAAYFENGELPPVFAKLPAGVVKTICLLALKTGMRQGELVALSWGDVDLGGRVIRVRRSYTDGYLSSPKNHERRDVDLTNEVVDLLGEWWAESGKPTGNDVLVFPGEGKTGYLSGTTILSHLYAAMAAAEVARVGPTGEKRTFHSLRHTFAKRALENGTSVSWLSRHLGHGSLKVTTDIYGHWERAERKKQAARLEGVFGV
jgi:integrase